MDDSSTDAGPSIDVLQSGTPATLAPESSSAWRAPSSRADHIAEARALDNVRQGNCNDAIKILMIAYGEALTGFIARVLRDRELAKDVRQQVFLEALLGLPRFEQRSTVWSWLCGIAFNRCVDARRKRTRTGLMDDFVVWEELLGKLDPMMDEARIAKRRALEQCLGKLPDAMRSQLLMRYFLGLSHIEIANAVNDSPGAVQVRFSRLLPRLRKCLHSNGVTR